MRITSVLVVFVVALMGLDVQAQRRSAGRATVAVVVTEASGARVGGVRVTLQGPVAREARTEQGRLVFEGIPAGTYRLRFERDGFVTLEREVLARPGAPSDVRVTLTRAPRPTPNIQPVPPLVDADPVAVDIPAFIEKNFVGRAAGKSSPLACATGGEATLIQLHAPLAEHTHPAADEYFYVIAGEGSARAGTGERQLRAGVFMLVPRGVRHTLTASGRSPLVVISIKAGERCTPNAG